MMYTTYHLSSAQDINADILDAIKAAFKTKAITIIVEEDDADSLTAEMKAVLDERLDDADAEYVTAESSLNQLRQKYGV
ncbi:MAG: hypothetical protein J7539_18045 [Niabella sp.]|nr:hypothetical protein [Niabella sp.]